MYGYIRFIVANKNFNESCKVNEQCKGTTNANTCQFKEEGVCSCDKEHSFIVGECLKGKKTHTYCIKYTLKAYFKLYLNVFK